MNRRGSQERILMHSWLRADGAAGFEQFTFLFKFLFAHYIQDLKDQLTGTGYGLFGTATCYMFLITLTSCQISSV